jgi:hypothetical protein
MARVSTLPKIDLETLGLSDYNVVLGKYHNVLSKSYFLLDGL